jgi:type II secretory pathway component GspD/PulD (secretin)
MKGLPGQPVTDENGYYNATVKWDWKGTVTPMKDGYTFEPTDKTYTEVTADMSSEDYIPTPITYTISGKAGMEGVEISGLPGSPITGSDGSYVATVEYGWSGTVTPIKEGYAFKPSKKEYAPVKSNQTKQDYTAEEITLSISGTAGVEGAVMNGLPGNPVTRKDGLYDVKVKYGWSGTVTPTKDGYEFNPVDMQYANVIADEPRQNYAATVLTYTITGTAGMEGVQMKGLPGDPVTDENGYYTATVDYGFSKTVTPVKEGHRFEPASKIYTKVNSDRTDQNYSATLITLTISGTTKLEGVELNGLPGNPITGKDGSYEVTVDYGWNGTVTPIKEGYTFTPDSKPFLSVTRDLTNQNHIAKPITFTISGSAGVAGVTMKGLPGRGAVLTGPGGIYTTTVEYGWSGTVAPTKEGYAFDPPNIQYDNLMGPETNQNYTATLRKHTISGKIISDKGQPIEGADVVADTGGGSGTTDASGEYELSVTYGWRGKVTPTTEGYTFRPTNKPYATVTSDQTKQDFTATVVMLTISDVVKSGQTPIPGVLITASNGGGTATTDAKGRFTVKVPYDWSGDIIPTKRGIKFNPPSEPYSNVIQNIKEGVPQVVKPPEPTIPKPTVPEPAVPEPTIPEPTVPEPTPTEVELPKTPLQKDIARMQKTLEDLLKKQAGEEQPPTATQVGELPPEPRLQLITNTFVDSDLTLEVLPAIASQAGISIIADETVVGLVTCDLKSVPLETALEIVLAGTNYVVKTTPYYYLVCSGDIESTMFPVVSETRRITMNYISADSAVGLLSTAFRRYVQAEPGPTGTDTYAVVVTAPPALMNRIIADLKQIDRVPAHVLLDARIVVMERGDLLNMGVEWGWPRIQAGLFGSDHYGGGDPVNEFGGNWPWGVQIGYAPDATFTNSLQLTLNLLAQNGEATILSKPQVLAQDGKQAQMKVMTEEYYMLTSPDLGVGFFARTELQQIDSGTTLTITPHIGDNNDITLQMSIEVSDSIPRARETDLPVVTRRTAENVVRIKDGGTVALAGLTENRSSTDNRRTPGLSRLPLLGPLFKSTGRTNSTREIAVFVTANIVPEHQRTVEFAEPSAIQAPVVQPAGEDFRASLRESLSRQIR